MAITLMYITNNPRLAEIAQEAGVDRIWIDLEIKGKEERQFGMNTVKSKHSIDDIYRVRPVVNQSELMVRINPLDNESEKEINKVIEAGADYVMLPMYKSKEEVERFIELVDGRAKTMLLLETKEAQACLEEYVGVKGIDEIHIGLNDLHLAYKKNFMFELLTDGTVDSIAKVLKKNKIRFGFGGFARIGYGILPAENILTQHYALGSQMAILSRGFCDANIIDDPEKIREIFVEGVKNIRKKEVEISTYTNEQFEENYKILCEKVAQIVENIRSKK